MGFIIITVLMLIVAGCCFWFSRIPATDTSNLPRDAQKSQQFIASVKFGMSLVGWVMVVLVILITTYNSYKQIPAGSVGVVYQFGAIKDQITEGPNFIWPWRSAKLANVQTQGHPFEKLSCFSKETQEVIVKATVNLNVSSQAIQTLYRTVGPQWFLILVAPRVEQNFKDEIVQYPSLDIAPHREKIRKAVAVRLEKELSPYSIEVTDLLLNNIDFLPAFKASIENKQIATQDALREQEKVKGETAKANQKIEEAKGEAQSIYLKAEKQAQANEKLAASLTPSLIQWAMVQKLAPNVSVMMIPSNQGLIMSPEMFKK